MRPMGAMLRACTLLATTALAAGAFGQINNFPLMPSDQHDWLPYLKGFNSRITTQTTTLIDNQNDWVQYYSRLTGQPPQSAPSVEFMKYKIIAITLGQRPSAGYSLTVTRVGKPQMQTAAVEAVERAPQRGTAVAQVLTSPYAMVLVPRQVMNVRLNITRAAPQVQPTGCLPGCTCTCPCCRDRHGNGGQGGTGQGGLGQGGSWSPLRGNGGG